MIDILGIKYDIELVDKVDNDPNVAGLIIYEDTKIFIKKGLSEERRKQTIIHEVVHALLYEMNLIKENENEDLVERLSVALNHFLRNNQEIINEYKKEEN